MFCRRGFTLKCDFVAGADHSYVKQVHVECKENKETAPAGLFHHVAWFVASSLVLVHVLVGCLLWLLPNALVVTVLSLLLVFADWCLLTEYGGLFCRRGSP